MALKPGEYIHVAIPKWYWICILSGMLLTISIPLAAGIISLASNQPLLTEGPNSTTLLEKSMVAAFFTSLISGGLLVLGVYTFPRSVRNVSKHPQKLWPPWSD